jgi:hypothetical protein
MNIFKHQKNHTAHGITPFHGGVFFFWTPGLPGTSLGTHRSSAMQLPYALVEFFHGPLIEIDSIFAKKHIKKPPFRHYYGIFHGEG